jgi:MFS family permease
VTEQVEAIGSSPPKGQMVPRYAWFVLGVLVLVYTFNFADRQILSIIAVDVKKDLGLSDADLGFLYGTAFGVFYALFGIPLGRLADSLNRVRLVTTGLTVWSSMTTLSGLAQSGAQLALARFGVGIGEATAGPCSYSLVADYFPKEKRATALSILTSGVYLGGGLSLMVGGAVKDAWNKTYLSGNAPGGLVGWQAAFLAVGLPGLLLAILVGSLREPKRGQSDGISQSLSLYPFRDFGQELIAIVPPFTLIGAARRGQRALMVNILAAFIVAASVLLLTRLTGDRAQWTAEGIGVYAVFSWATALRERDPPTFALIWGTPTFLFVTLGYGLISFMAYAVGFWASPYAILTLGASAHDAGFWIGILGASGGAIGIISGGLVGDRLRKTHASGRIMVALVGATLPAIPLALAFTMANLQQFYVLHFLLTALSSCALGSSAATAMDLVLPRMRGTAAASFFIGTTLIGLALGPYLAGRISTLTGDLSTGVLSILAVLPISVGCLIATYRLLPKAEASLLDRARAAGEKM